MRMALVAILIFSFSCTNITVNRSNKMQNKYFTQEGKSYILRRETKRTVFSSVGANTYRLSAIVNDPTAVNILSPNTLVVKTEKKIIPVECSFSVTDENTGDVLIDVTTPFYYMTRGVSGSNYFSYETIAVLSKVIPLVERVFYTDNNHFNYNLRYGQIRFTENDFISTASGLTLFFMNSQSNAMTVNENISARPNLPTGDYIGTIALTYFELE